VKNLSSPKKLRSNSIYIEYLKNDRIYNSDVMQTLSAIRSTNSKIRLTRYLPGKCAETPAESSFIQLS
jgi:hypothetical protein